MKINKIKFKNFGSYGNVASELDLTKEESGLHLITGKNGAGKCVSGNTQINIKFTDTVIEEQFEKFLKSKYPVNDDHHKKTESDSLLISD